MGSIPISSLPLGTDQSQGPYKPPQWSNQKQLTSVTANIPTGGSVVSHTIGFGDIGDPDSSVDGGAQSTNRVSTTPVTYFFDAVLSVDHHSELRMTEHPVQSGASLVDHAYMLPLRVTMEVGFSDSMASYKEGQYTSAASKSISAFQKFQELQQARTAMTISTRLRQYQNMLIERIESPDTNVTAHALRMTITFKQIILGTVNTTTSNGDQSARPDQSQTTNEGTLQPVNPPQSITSSHDQSGQWNSDPQPPPTAPTP